MAKIGYAALALFALAVLAFGWVSMRPAGHFFPSPGIAAVAVPCVIAIIFAVRKILRR